MLARLPGAAAALGRARTLSGSAAMGYDHGYEGRRSSTSVWISILLASRAGYKGALWVHYHALRSVHWR